LGRDRAAGHFLSAYWIPTGKQSKETVVSVINHVKREINAKLVYVGPYGAGKKTSISLVHDRLRPECRSEVRTSGDGPGKLQFFDFLPREIGSVDGYHVRFHMYAATADAGDDGTLRMVLKGADGVVFVADASPGREDICRSALSQVEEVLALHGLDRGQVPLVVQLNKRDLCTSREDGHPPLAAYFAANGLEIVETNARQGEGVLGVVSLLVKKVMKEIRRSGVQVQEPEMIEEDSYDDTEEWEDGAAGLRSPVSSLSRQESGGGWRVTVPAEGCRSHDGQLMLPVLLTHADGRHCRLTLTVAVTEEG
jgi:GTPase SAR1 family protein